MEVRKKVIDCIVVFRAFFPWMTFCALDLRVICKPVLVTVQINVNQMRELGLSVQTNVFHLYPFYVVFDEVVLRINDRTVLSHCTGVSA